MKMRKKRKLCRIPAYVNPPWAVTDEDIERAENYLEETRSVFHSLLMLQGFGERCTFGPVQQHAS